VIRGEGVKSEQAAALAASYAHPAYQHLCRICKPKVGRLHLAPATNVNERLFVYELDETAARRLARRQSLHWADQCVYDPDQPVHMQLRAWTSFVHRAAPTTCWSARGSSQALPVVLPDEISGNRPGKIGSIYCAVREPDPPQATGVSLAKRSAEFVPRLSIATSGVGLDATCSV